MDIPAGLKLSLVDLATPEGSLGAGAEIDAVPSRGTTGRVTVRVRWFFPVPIGHVAFRLRVYASPSGDPPSVETPLTEHASHARMKRLIEQDAPVDMTVDGPLMETFRRKILDRGGEIRSAEVSGVARSQELTSIAIVGIVLAVLAAICIVTGFAAFGAVLLIAMQKGYNIDDAGYGVAVGEGASRQEHKMVFNIRKPD